MTLRFSKKEVYVLLAAILLTVSSVLSGYFLYLSPIKQDVETQRATLKSEQQLLATLQEKQPEASQVTAESIAVLQRKVPVKPQLEQLILDLERAEVVSGSLITNMEFSEGEVEAPANNVAPQQETTEGEKDTIDNEDENTAENEQENKENQNGEDTENEQEIKEPEVEATPLPSGIKKLTVTLDVESSTYEDLKKFIDTLENLPRSVVVESVTFRGPKEVTGTEQPDYKLGYQLVISAFYMPSLTDFQDKLPELIAPQPGNKTNPFYTSPDLN